MLFVMVGTHEQPFNRLVNYMDICKRDGAIEDEIIMQTGYCTYEPRYCSWSKFFPYKQMVKNVADARIVITHGGPSSFIMPLQVGKIPIVVPRQKQFDEHVNAHQVDFSNQVAKRQGNIIVVENIDDLKETIINYESITKSMTAGLESNNVVFNEKFAKIVDDLVKREKDD